MRPILEKTSKYCAQCTETLGIFDKPDNCMCCGKRFCNKCMIYKVQLDFLGYIYKERVCRYCNNFIIIPRKIEAREKLIGKIEKEKKISIDNTKKLSDFSKIKV